MVEIEKTFPVERIELQRASSIGKTLTKPEDPGETLDRLRLIITERAAAQEVNNLSNGRMRVW